MIYLLASLFQQEIKIVWLCVVVTTVLLTVVAAMIQVAILAVAKMMTTAVATILALMIYLNKLKKGGFMQFLEEEKICVGNFATISNVIYMADTGGGCNCDGDVDECIGSGAD
jgi:hypothetical protein